AGNAAAKDLICVPVADGASSCLLSGLNQNTISDGVVATAILTLSPQTAANSAVVSVTGAASSSNDGLPIGVDASGSAVTLVSSAPPVAPPAADPSAPSDPVPPAPPANPVLAGLTCSQ